MATPARDKHRVVILGGGFGGLLAAKTFRGAEEVDVTLIDKRNFHVFQPLLYQVATGSLAPGDIAAPLRGILAKQCNTRVLLGEVVDLDPADKLVAMSDGQRIPYDSLIVATGSQTSYFGHDHWRQWAPSLKSIEDATAVRHKILYAFEAAERAQTAEERQAWLTFVIVGGGATGVELAGAVAVIARHTLRDNFRTIHPEQAQIVILDGSERPLPHYPPDLSAHAERSLLKLGVRVRSRTRVTDINAEGVSFTTADGVRAEMRSRTVLWAGGVMPSDFAKRVATRLGAPLDRAGRIKVNPDLTVPGRPDIYIAGDLALALRPNGTPLPGVCQVGMQEGAYAAKTILRRLRGSFEVKPFRYFDRGDMAVIGRGAAVANIFGVHVWGWMAWLVWLFIHLIYLVQFESRIIVFMRWGFQYLTFHRGSRLITGHLQPASGDPSERAA